MQLAAVAVELDFWSPEIEFKAFLQFAEGRTDPAGIWACIGKECSHIRAAGNDHLRQIESGEIIAIVNLYRGKILRLLFRAIGQAEKLTFLSLGQASLDRREGRLDPAWDLVRATDADMDVHERDGNTPERHRLQGRLQGLIRGEMDFTACGNGDAFTGVRVYAYASFLPVKVEGSELPQSQDPGLAEEHLDAFQYDADHLFRFKVRQVSGHLISQRLWQLSTVNPAFRAGWVCAFSWASVSVHCKKNSCLSSRSIRLRRGKTARDLGSGILEMTGGRYNSQIVTFPSQDLSLSPAHCGASFLHDCGENRYDNVTVRVLIHSSCTGIPWRT